VVFTEHPRGYEVDGVRVPSVTTALGIIDKPALVGWAARVTAEGAWRLARRKDYTIPDSSWNFIKDLKTYGYDHRSQTTGAADRGTAVHQVLEDWITEQRIPHAGSFPSSVRGYVRGLAKWLTEWHPSFLESEKVVGSAIHGFAGTRDTVCVLQDDKRGRVLLDLKTSKRIYPASMFPQLIAYEIAGVECGEEPTQSQGIVRVGADGTYEVAWSCAEPEDFLSILRAYKSQQALIERAKAAR
jgi:hypothetical protein